MRLDALPADPIAPTASDRKPAADGQFRATLRAAKHREDDRDVREDRDAAKPRDAEPHDAQDVGKQHVAGKQREDDAATAAAQAAQQKAVSDTPVLDEVRAPVAVVAADAVQLAAPPAAVAEQPAVASVDKPDVMTTGSTESAASTALTASIAATLAFATGNAGRADTAPPPVTAKAHEALPPELAAAISAAQARVQAQPAPQPAATPAAKPAEDDVATMVAAAVSRAVSSFRGHAAAQASQPAQPAAEAANAAAAAAPVLAPALDQIVNLTPLEQAVHELIGKIADQPARDKPTVPDDADLAPFHAMASAHLAARSAGEAATATAPTTAAPVRAASPVHPSELPVNPNPSHLHLVVDDGPERTVVTVAMRGTDVHVAMRSTDDTTASALARNAASLDHAMRARGLHLGELTAERDAQPDRQPPQRDPEPRERRDPRAPRFTIEETPR